MKFNINEPLSSEIINKEKSNAERRLKNKWQYAIGATIGVSFLHFSLPTNLLIAVSHSLFSTELHSLNWFDTPIKALINTIFVSSVSFGMYYLHYSRINKELSDIDLSNCASIAGLCKHSEINDYRLKVIKYRKLTNGDFNAMKKYSEELDELKVVKLNLAKDIAINHSQQVVFENLHKININ